MIAMSKPLELSFWGAAFLAVFLCITPVTAEAGPDVGGAVDSLASTALDPAGDLIGGGSLISASLIGIVGDIVSVLDDNNVVEPFLGGLISQPIRRVALGISQMGTGALEGFHAGDRKNLPEAAGNYLDPQGDAGAVVETRVKTFAMGIGAIPVAVVDLLTDAGMIFTKLVGAEGATGTLSGWHNDTHNSVFGPAM